MAIDPSTALFIAQAGYSLYKYINPDRRTELINEVVENQVNFRDQLARHAFGNFNVSERETINRGAEPQINQIASNVAARGLGESGAGTQIIAEAQQAPFFQAQQRAQNLLPAADAALLQTAGSLGQGDAITSLLGSLQKKIALFEGDTDTTLTFKTLFDMLAGREETTGQGYSIPDQTAFQQRGDLQYGGGRI